MSDKPDNPPAFPMHDQYLSDGTPVMQGSYGMSLRDYFAGQALAGICASGPGQSFTDEIIAQEAYNLADAMLTMRAKSEGK